MVLYVKRSFERLSNLHVLFRWRKNKQLQQLASSLSIYTSTKFGIDKKTQKIECIKITPLTTECYPVLTSLRNYMVYRRVN